VVATIRSSIASISALPMERASSGMITKGVRVITDTSAAGKNRQPYPALQGFQRRQGRMAAIERE